MTLFQLMACTMIAGFMYMIGGTRNNEKHLIILDKFLYNMKLLIETLCEMSIMVGTCVVAWFALEGCPVDYILSDATVILVGAMYLFVLLDAISELIISIMATKKAK